MCASDGFCNGFCTTHSLLKALSTHTFLRYPTRRWVLVGGYLVNPSSIPAWIRWARYLSPLSFAFEVLAANEMADQSYVLDVSGFARVEDIGGEVFLRTLGLRPGHVLDSALALACFYAGAVLLAFCAMAFALWRPRGGPGGASRCVPPRLLAWLRNSRGAGLQ
jgi:hypothetical protein